MVLNTTHQIDLRRMRTVVEVARAEAITTAAETLGLTQSAVSRTVAEVEDALGVRLFERLPRGIRPTDAGQRFVARARRLLTDADDLVSEVRATPTLVTGRLRIGLTSAGSQATRPLARLAAGYPGVAIETVNGTAETLCPRVLQGELDLVVGPSSYLRRWRELEVTRLARMYFGCVFRKGHPLAGAERPSEEEVLGYPVILPESVEPTYSDIGQRYLHHGLPPLQPRYVTDDFDLALRIVYRTDAFYPLMIPSDSFEELERNFFVLRDGVEMPLRYLSYARAAHRPRTALVEAFEALLVEHLHHAEEPARI